MSICSAFLLFACSNVKTAQSQNSWHSLYDGKTLSEWHTYGKDRAGHAWEATAAGIHLNPQIQDKAERGDLVTNESYDDFHLQLEWKVAEGGNSGIMFHVQENPAEYPATYSTGPEMQVLDNARHADAQIHKHRAGDLYDLIASSTETAKPAGEWNKVDIIVNDNTLEFRLNSKQIVYTSMHDEDWKELIAGSKFAKMPGFGTFTSGKIALQDHGDEVWYRHIRIKRL